MKIRTGKVSTDDLQSLAITTKISDALSGVTDLAIAMTKVATVMDTTNGLWKFGRGGNHIWISNLVNERVLMITENVE